MIRTLNAAIAYFGIVFLVGFFLGMIRVPLLVPAIGERNAELLEMPFMLAAIFFSARWIIRRFNLKSILTALLCGFIAAALLLIVEFSVVFWIRGMSIREFIANRDPFAAFVYYIAVAIFALMPVVLTVSRRGNE